MTGTAYWLIQNLSGLMDASGKVGIVAGSRHLALAKRPSPVLGSLKFGEIKLPMASTFPISDDEKLSLKVLD